MVEGGAVVRRRMVEGGGCGKKAYGRGREKAYGRGRGLW